MKTFIMILTILVLSLLLHWLIPAMPWFTPFIIASIAGMATSRMKPNAFLGGFLGIGIFWILLMLLSHLRNDGLLTGQISALFSAKMGTNITPALLIIISTLMGSLLGGLSAAGGKLLAGPAARKQGRRKGRRNGSSYRLKLN